MHFKSTRNLNRNLDNLLKNQFLTTLSRKLLNFISKILNLIMKELQSNKKDMIQIILHNNYFKIMIKRFIHQLIIEVNTNYQSRCPLHLPKDIKLQDNNQMIKKYLNLKKLNKDQNQNKRFKF